MRTFTRKTNRSAGVVGDKVRAVDVNELQEAIEDLQTGDLAIPHIESILNAIPTEVDDVTNMRVGIFYVLDADGINADGVTDDSAAITAVYDLAAAVSGDNRQYRKAVVIWPPGTSFRIASSLPAYAQVHTQGNGARLVGPITGAERITAATAIPDSDDVDGQTAGAAFVDDEPAANGLYWPSWDDLIIDGFRFGFVSKCHSWVHPQFKRIEFRNTDIGYFVYQGCQQWTITDPLAGNDTNCLIAAVATCFAADNPLSSEDNFFCDGLRIAARRQTMNLTNNDDVNEWFEDAILRPATSSVTVAESTTFAPTGTFRKVTGRVVYAPSRNPRGLYGWEVGPLNLYDGPRGAVLMRYPIDASFRDIAGEQMFTDATVNTGPDESMIVVGVADTVTSASFHNIDADNSAGGADYKGAIDVVAEVATTQTQFVGTQITGYADPRYFTILDQMETADGGVVSQAISSRAHNSYPAIVSESGGGTLDITTAYLKTAQGRIRSVTDHESHNLRQQLFADRLPQVGGAQTKAYLSLSGDNGLDTAGQVIKGTCRLYIERLDTGEMDFAEYLVSLSQRFAASTTLGADAAAAATTITVASESAANAFSPGTAILIDATEKALVKSRSGAVLTLNQGLTGSFTSGDAVTSVSTVVTTIQALTNAWVAVGIESNMFRITNSIDPVPVQFTALFEYPSPRF